MARPPQRNWWVQLVTILAGLLSGGCSQYSQSPMGRFTIRRPTRDLSAQIRWGVRDGDMDRYLRLCCVSLVGCVLFDCQCRLPYLDLPF
jgi:hypothetical protein